MTSASSPPTERLFRIHPLDAVGALIIFASTLYLVPHAAFAVGAGILVLRHGVRFQQRDILLAIFVVGALLNILFHSGERAFDETISSAGVPLIVLTVMAGRSLPAPVIHMLILLVCLEVPVGLFEFFTGRLALTAGQAAMSHQDMTTAAELLYDRRVLGLSANSSIFAEKLFLAVLFTVGSNLRTRTKYIILGILFAGLYVTFNRTAILATAMFFAVQIALWGMKSPRRMPILLLVFVTGVSIVIAAAQPLIDQFTRGTGGTTYSELARVQYLRAAIDTLVQSPMFGNGSFNWSVFDPLVGTNQHAHNSVMMLLAEHGLILGTVMIVFVAMGVRRETAPYLFAMLVFSLSQYFFFWNMSMADLALHHFARKGRDVEALLGKRAPTVPMPWERGRQRLRGR